MVGLLHTFIISETTILTISRRSRGLGLAFLSKLCTNSSGSFCHGIWNFSTQLGSKVEQLLEGDEVAEDDAGKGETEGGEEQTDSGEEHAAVGVLESVTEEQRKH